MTDYKDRRSSERIEVLLPIDYYTDRDRVQKFNIVSNISYGGAYVHTSRPYKVGEEADFILSFFDAEKPDDSPRRYVVRGQVRHVASSRHRETEKAVGMGVQWLDLDSTMWEEMKTTIDLQLGAAHF